MYNSLYDEKKYSPYLQHINISVDNLHFTIRQQ